MRNNSIYKFLAFYILGLFLLYLSIFLSNHISYNGHFISELPIIMPMVFSLAAIAISVLFILDREYPWMFRTGMMSLADGTTFFVFGIISYSLGVRSIVWASSVGIGVLFIIAAIVRLLIQGGLSVYRKSKTER